MGFLGGRHQPRTRQARVLRQRGCPICVRDGQFPGEGGEGTTRRSKQLKFSKYPLKNKNKNEKPLTFSPENELTTLATSDYRNLTNLRCQEVYLLHLPRGQTEANLWCENPTRRISGERPGAPLWGLGQSWNLKDNVLPLGLGSEWAAQLRPFHEQSSSCSAPFLITFLSVSYTS